MMVLELVLQQTQCPLILPLASEKKEEHGTARIRRQPTSSALHRTCSARKIFARKTREVGASGWARDAAIMIEIRKKKETYRFSEMMTFLTRFASRYGPSHGFLNSVVLVDCGGKNLLLPGGFQAGTYLFSGAGSVRRWT